METNYAEFLTPKQQLFCGEYLIDRNATRAALRAGYSGETALSGYLMRMPKIKLYLQQRTEHIAQQMQVSHDMVLRELSKIAFGNMGNYFDDTGAIKPMDKLTEDEKAALWSVSVAEKIKVAEAVAVTKFRMYNKLSALDKIAKHIGFYAPELKKPEPVYVYLDKEAMTEDDWFEDEDETSPQPSPKERDFDLQAENGSRPEAESKKQEMNLENDGERRAKDGEHITEFETGSFEVGYSAQPYPLERVFDLQGRHVEALGPLVANMVEPEVVNSGMVVPRPNIDVPRLSGKLITADVRKERKEEAKQWRNY